MATKGEIPALPNWVRRVLIGRNPKRTLLRMLIWAAVLLVIGNFVLLPIRVVGISMLPTYQDRSVNVVNCLAYLFHSPQRGDVVAIRYSDKHAMLMKRIIGLPGETVQFHHGRALVNGKPLAEPYVRFPCNWEHGPEPVGWDEYYVVGDNRAMDLNEHEHGRAERKRIIGKVVL